jgi:hypothetical protein
MDLMLMGCLKMNLREIVGRDRVCRVVVAHALLGSMDRATAWASASHYIMWLMKSLAKAIADANAHDQINAPQRKPRTACVRSVFLASMFDKIQHFTIHPLQNLPKKSHMKNE